MTLQRILYFDHAAATPLDPEVETAMQPYYATNFFNPSGISLKSKKVAQDISIYRKSIAALIGANEGEVFFTAGGTEANNLAIQGLMVQHPKGKVLTTSIEHDSVLKPSERFDFGRITVNHKGRVEVSSLRSLVSDEVVLISCIYVSNEIGTTQPLREISAIVSEVRRDRQSRGVKTPIYLHSDACQAALHFDLNVARLGLDMMTVNGGKIYGSKQTAFLYVRAGVKLEPLILGGGQEWGLRAGTENVAGIAGLSTAFVKARKIAIKEKDRLSTLRDYFESRLFAEFSDLVRYGDRKHCSPHHLSISFPGVDNERLLMMLDERNIIAGAGSACHAAKGIPSSVLRAMGVSDESAASTIRWSLGRETREPDIDHVLSVLINIMPEAKRLS